MCGLSIVSDSRYVPGATEMTAPPAGATSIARWIDQKSPVPSAATYKVLSMGGTLTAMRGAEDSMGNGTKRDEQAPGVPRRLLGVRLTVTSRPLGARFPSEGPRVMRASIASR